ncbi:hypothetical protein BDD12DRAFT_806498 [Trichophaea hybrida]|nr:hypothetical protein BDD12DRAFT_806498 [Trichophaea hybrida]
MWDYEAFVKEEAFEDPHHQEPKEGKDFVSEESVSPNQKITIHRHQLLKSSTVPPKSPSMSVNEERRQLLAALALQARINMFNSPKKLRQSVPSDPRSSEEPPLTDEEWSDEGKSERMQPKQWTLRGVPPTTTVAPAQFPTRGPSKRKKTTTGYTPPSAGTTTAQYTEELELWSSGETTPTQHYDRTQHLPLTMGDSQTWDTIVLANQPSTPPESTSSGTPPGSQKMTRSSQQGTLGKTRTGSSPAPKGTLKEPRIEVPSYLSPEPFGSPV